MVIQRSPVQTVIAGHKEAVETVSKDALTAGAKKAVVLPVSAPFHSALMKPAEIKLQKELEATEFYDLSFPVINNIEAKPLQKSFLTFEFIPLKNLGNQNQKVG